jgi:uncharacterized phage-associated protein
MDKIREITKTSAVELANYILQEKGVMSHLKLQKLLYYCQGYHLGYFENELIPEDFEAWVHGPVCRKVYDEFKNTSTLHYDLEFKGPKISLRQLTTEQKELIDEVLDVYSQYAGFELEIMTHKELPWKKARGNTPPFASSNENIDKRVMLNFFKEELNEHEEA